MRGRNIVNGKRVDIKGAKTVQRLEFNESPIANTITSVQKDNLILDVDYRIRRLTPKEVFRLMGYSDDFYELCRALNSDTQLYKQGGNSIVVDTIMWLLVEVCRALNISFKMPEKDVN